MNRRHKTTMETLEVTQEAMESWEKPPFQRPLNENKKVMALAEKMKQDGGVWPGVVTLGAVGSKVFLIDGQHRQAAFLISGMPAGLADVRTIRFSNLSEMGEEFVRLNSQISSLRPDDILRAMEDSNPSLRTIRELCPFVGYDMVRRGARTPILSMSLVIRVWRAAAQETPQSSGIGTSASNLAAALTVEESATMCRFLNICLESFGRDQEYFRLWTALNLTICAWIYKRIVLTKYSTKSQQISDDMFKKCLMSLSSNGTYLDWLVGRSLGDRDRSPCYNRVKQIFANRIHEETGKRPLFPGPAWAPSSSNKFQ